jgi:hypothetical protein
MDIPQVLKVSQLTTTEVHNAHSLWRSLLQIQGRQHRFYIKQFIFVHYASFFTNLILSMKSVLLQRAQEGESSGIFFDILVSFHILRRQWIIKDKQINKIGWILR